MNGRPPPPAPDLLLPEELAAPPEIRRQLDEDYDRFADAPYPQPVEEYIRETYQIDLAARYGPLPLRNPVGKASGQLSLNAEQVRADVEEGLGFVVLKTVIAEDAAGSSQMEEWKIKAPRMVCERIASRRGQKGWTISWKGRGWEGTLSSYLQFLKESLEIGAARGLPVIPSVKLHLPPQADEPFRLEEYRHTIPLLGEAWRSVHGGQPLVLEKDFSPTLAGSSRAQAKALILLWLEEVPRLIKQSALSGQTISLGVKVMNALFEDAFQLEMLEQLSKPDNPTDFLVAFNRLFDPERRFGEHRGIAYGGFDLSDRNLWALERWARRLALLEKAGKDSPPPRRLPISGTGNIVTGRLLAEYALRGATSCQLHTFFQLPRQLYRSRAGSRTRAAFHELLFHPAVGLIAAMAWLRSAWLELGSLEPIHFLDLPALGRERILSKL